MKQVDLIIPVLNEEKNIPALYEKIIEVTENLKDKYTFRFIFTDNHSSDRTFESLEEISKNEERLTVIRFSRNFGYQHSILTGYRNSTGDAAIQLDADFQDPPEMIADFIKKWEQGYQVVYGVRKSRKESFHIELLRKLFYRVLNLLSEHDIPVDAGDFRLVDRKIIDYISNMNDSSPYLRGTITTAGFKQVGIPYDRPDRRAGETKFSFASMFRLALDGILNHSIIPLQLSTYFGLLVSATTLIMTLLYLAGKFIYGDEWTQGFATTTVLTLMGISLNALFLGIIGEYLGRIYLQVKGIPKLAVERTIKCDNPKL